MRDFTLPTDLTLRGITVVSYEDELNETLDMLEKNNGHDDGSAEFATLIERARDANRIAFELFYNGIIDESKRQDVTDACAPFLPKRTSARPTLV